MDKKYRAASILGAIILGAALLAAGCGGNKPRITAVKLDRTEVPRYESIEMKVTLEAQYTNPYDARQVSLDGVFTAPDGKQMTVPGFWDGEEAWRMRFTPSQIGKWNYQLVIKDSRGASAPYKGKFTVTSSDLHGWLQAGNWVNPAYSGHYLVYQDGTPFYGVGHCDAFSMLADGFSVDQGVSLFNKMKQVGENYVVWWPLWSNSPISSSYDDYSTGATKVIDMIVADAQKKGIFLVFTIWDHPELRDLTYPEKIEPGHWANNGFNKLGDLKSFFTSEEAWAWQENFYRYIIARWGYSPAIGMWQTVSEINNTNAFDQTDAWHKKVNDYFVANDPYRHPTTASRSGRTKDIPWPEGHKVMDVPEVHIFDPFGDNPVGAASVLAEWTTVMWNEAEKPNWVGEFGDKNNIYSNYPEFFHNSIWAALASGAALAPSQWNYSNNYATLMPQISADNSRLAQFVAGLPLAQWNPTPLQIGSSDPQVRGWGVAGKDGGLFWVQDFSLEGKSIDEVRNEQTVRKGVQVEVQGVSGGTYTITPYDTWQGTYLAAFEVTCTEGQPCVIALPDFKADLAFKIERK